MRELKIYPGTTGRRYEILRLIAADPYITQPQIAQRLGITLAHTHVLMQELRRKKLVQSRFELKVKVLDTTGDVIKPGAELEDTNA